MKSFVFVFLLTFLYVFSLPFTLKSQSKCGTVEYEKMQGREEKKFENWMAEKLEIRSRINKNKRSLQTQSSYIIPVVVHVVHNGEDIGVGSNISDAQIKSQIKVLNEDYQRKNPDAGNTPANFAAVAGKMDIQFVLARQTPDNRPTNGIVRVKGAKKSWDVLNSGGDDLALKSSSYWPAEKYLNIWVTAISSNIIGYAQFPDYTGVKGLEGNTTNRKTDGVVIQYNCFGSNNDKENFPLAEDYTRGRTTTHEVGHYLGLRHVWGDDYNCKGTDYVEDTPTQNKDYGNAKDFDKDYGKECPNVPQYSCGTESMYQNYLNYTKDKCMNLFTKGQTERMDIVLNNAPLRKELLTSPGANAPTGDPLQYDLRVVDAGPATVTCNPLHTPFITVYNNSNYDLEEIQVKRTFNNRSAVFTVSTAKIPQKKLSKITLKDLTLIDGNNTLSIEVLPPDGITDANPSDNKIAYSVVFNTSQETIPVRENFESEPLWLSAGTYNYNWKIEKAGTQAAKASFVDSQKNAKAFLVSPTFDFIRFQKASVFFDVSYGYKASSLDTLKLLVSKDCGATFEKQPLYVKASASLSTAKAETSWLPSLTSDWRREYVSLTALVSNSALRFAFCAIGSGNNIFVDNIEFFTDDNPEPVSTPPWYSVYGFPDNYRITFNLESRQEITIQLYNTLGQEMLEETIPDVLNQTVALNTRSVNPGMYILRLTGKEKAATRIFVK